MVKDVTWGLIGLATVVGTVALTAMGKLPTEVMASIVSIVITAIFKERETDKVRKSWEQWAREREDKA